MKLPRSEIELMQGVIDHRFGGNAEPVARGLDWMQKELARPPGIMSFYERVGNNCLVFYSNEQAKKVCREHPETIQGVIVDDYDCWIHPEAVVVGSYLKGSVGSPAVIDFESRVFYSNVVMSHVRRSRVTTSHVSIGNVEESVVVGSFISGNVDRSDLTRVSLSGRAVEETVVGKILDFALGDHPDTTGHVAYMLNRHGLSPDLDETLSA